MPKSSGMPMHLCWDKTSTMEKKKCCPVKTTQELNHTPTT